MPKHSDEADYQPVLADIRTRERAWMGDSTKDIRLHPLFRGDISKFTWRFIMYRFSPAGRWMLAATAVLALAATTAIEIEIFIPACYLLAVWVVAFIALLWNRPRVNLDVRHTDRVGVGQSIVVNARVTNTGRRALREVFLLPHMLPPPVDAVQRHGVPLPYLKPGESAEVKLGLRCVSRGVYALPGYRVETDYPLSVLCAYRVLQAPRELLVYPRFARLTRLDIPTGLRYQPGGVALASTLGESFEYIGNREYREGDNIRDIDWRATARLRSPIVREYREEYFHRVAVVLDTYLPRRYRPAQAEALEEAVSMAASVSDFMARQDYLVDLFAAGPNLYHLVAGRSLAYIDQILDILAAVEPSHVQPFDTLEPGILEHLAQITSVVCVFLDWDEARRAFVAKLSHQGAGVRVLIIRDGPCTMSPGAEEISDRISVLTPGDVAGGLEEV